MNENKKNVLVVEDDADLLFLMTKKLKEEGLNPIPVETGQQALDYLAKQKPDFILLDILLPDIDGLTVLNEISSKPETKDIPVIILSNLADQGAFEQAEAIGKYEYLVKAKTDLEVVTQKVKDRLGLK